MWISIALVALAMMTIGFDGTALQAGSTIVDQRDDRRQADEVIQSKIEKQQPMTKDHKLAKAVWNVLRGVPALSGNDTLKVNVKNAVVKLEGVVELPTQKEAAEKAVASVPGVATVINLIEVSSKAPNGIISESARERMFQEGVELKP